MPAEEVIATGRDAARLKELASDLGVTVRQADFADPATLAAAFKGVDKMLLVSTTTVGERFDNHRRAIDAARDSGVSLIVYTSTLNASGARMLLADEHRRTEEYLVASVVPCVILRNGWYLENYTDQLPVIVQHGAVLGSAGGGRVSAASRADYASAAVAVLAGEGHEGQIYELGGEAFTLAELATTISDVLRRDDVYTDLPTDEYAKVLVSAGLPDELAAVLADADAGLARGELYTDRSDLVSLLGRPATDRRVAVEAAVASIPQA